MFIYRGHLVRYGGEEVGVLAFEFNTMLISAYFLILPGFI